MAKISPSREATPNDAKTSVMKHAVVQRTARVIRPAGTG
jgi:hypothetical protein